MFAEGRRSHGKFLQLLGCPNSQGGARLGLVVSRKVAKRAVQRNYMKRSLREWFRLHRAMLPAIDVVAIVRQAFDRPARPGVEAEMASLIQRFRP